MPKAMKAFLFFLLISSIAFAQNMECPLGKNEDHLTIARVMRNFGRFILNAQSIAQRGTNPYEKFSDEEILLAIQKMETVVYCADAVLRSPQGDLLPVDARKLQGAELQAFLRQFLGFMTEFRKQVLEFREMFIVIYKTPAAQRDFRVLQPKSKAIDDLVDHAHGSF